MLSIDACEGAIARENISPEELGPLLLRQVEEGGKGRKPVLWVDVSAPGEEDWKMLAETFHFHPLAIEDARNQGQRAKVDTYDDYLFLSVRAWAGKKPTLVGTAEERKEILLKHAFVTADELTHEVDIFLGPNYLVTLHNGNCEALAETRKRWRSHPESAPEALHGSPAYLLYLLLDAIVDDYFPAMDFLDEEIDDVEMAVYAPNPRLDLQPALILKKKLLLLRQAVAPMRDVLNSLLRTDDPALMPAGVRVYLQDVYDHTLRLTEQVDLHRDILSGVLDAVAAQTGNRMNQVMKKLTGISTILMSAALVSGIYGMNFKVMPELNTRYGYYCALGGMVAIAGGLTAYFKKIDWF
jgi:magnesium transporter